MYALLEAPKPVDQPRKKPPDNGYDFNLVTNIVNLIRPPISTGFSNHYPMVHKTRVWIMP